MTNKNPPAIVFATIAQREVDFFLHVADLVKGEASVSFISFFEPGVKQIEAAGFTVFNLFKKHNRTQVTKTATSARLARADDFAKYTLHEQLTFGISDKEVVVKKYEGYYDRLFQHLSQLQQDNERVVVFQELGGFVAPMSLYFCCLDLGIEHIFFEPSFFQRRLHFNKNTLNFDENLTKARTTAEQKKATRAYIESFTKSRRRIAPKKDAAHYKRAGLLKLLNVNNFRKLSVKLKNKYLLGLNEEYSHIGNHVSRAIKAQITFFRLKTYYRSTAKVASSEAKVVFFPLHVSLDYQLTTRSPEFVDQIDVVEAIVDQLPEGWVLVIKEHPITVGTIPFGRISNLVLGGRVVLLHPETSMHEVLETCHAVVTINSKAGAEAVIYGKKVACLGQSFYKDFSTVEFMSICDIADFLDNGTTPVSQQADWLSDFTALWHGTYEGELYDLSRENVEQFSVSILRCVHDGAARITNQPQQVT